MNSSSRWLLPLLLAVGGLIESRAEVINGIKAVVHNAVITQGEVESDVRILAEEYWRLYGHQRELLNQKIEEALRDSLNRSIEHQLMLRDFEASGYTMPESVIDEVINTEIKRRFQGDRSLLVKTLQARGMTYEKWRQQERERFLVQQLQLKNVHQETIISPYKIETYYNEHKDEFKVEDQVKLRMIMLNKASENEAETTRELAQEILRKIKEGAAFSEMASIYSQGSQRSQGGDWGWADRATLRKELADVAFSLNAGQLSDVIETPQALFIMLVEDKRVAHHRPVAEVREQIEETLLRRERERLHARYIEKLRQKTFIRQFEF